MKPQTCPKPGETKPIAARVIVPLLKSDNPNSSVMFLPEFGGIAINFEIYDQTAITPRIKIPPTEVNGITAVFLVEVWGLQNGKPKRVQERWFFSEEPPGKSPQQYINNILNVEQAQTRPHYEQRQAERLVSFFKTEKAKEITPWNNARDATLRLLKREYGLLARALAGKKPAPEAQKAFIADCVRLTGCVDADVNLSDPKFVADLAEAQQAYDRRNARKSKVDALDWYLASPRHWLELHALPIEEITRKANLATGFNLSPGAIEKRIERLKLITPRKRGKPTKT